MSSRDALLVVDVQPDFCPGGKLAVPQGDEVLGPLNAWLEEAQSVGAPVYASRDWHPAGHPSFKPQGGPWPPHCLQDTPGAAFHPQLRLPGNVVKVSKGTRLDRDQYSLFDETGAVEHLRSRGVERVWVGGLALDVCVRASALDARRLGFDVCLIREATRPVDGDAGEKALEEMRAAGVQIG